MSVSIQNQPSKPEEKTVRILPAPIRKLAILGVIPFIILACLSILSDDSQATKFIQYQLYYSACVLSFLGAVHWGLALGQAPETLEDISWARMLWGVTPALLAWTSLMLAPQAAIIMLSMGFGAAYAADKLYASISLLPHSYIMMRAWLTFIVICSLICSLLRDAFFMTSTV